MKLRHCLFGLVTLVLVCTTGCGDSEDSDDDGSSDTGVCERCGAPDTDIEPDTGSNGSGDGPKADRELMGTCVNNPEDGSNENRTCTVYWAQYGSPADYGEDCTNNDPEDEWRPSEESCPAGSDHIGTCKRELGHVYQETYYYKPDEPASQKEGCEFMGQGNWEPAN